MQPLQVIRPELEPPAGRDFWTDFQEDGALPIFTINEVAFVFFGRSKLWLLRQVWDGNHFLDGKLIEIPRSPHGKYLLQLAHVERLAHALFSRGNIDLIKFENSLLIVKAIAGNYRLI
jgi:hypothetical protein